MITAQELRENNAYYFTGISEMIFPYENKIGIIKLNDNLEYCVEFDNMSNEMLHSYTNEGRDTNEFNSVDPIPLSPEILKKCKLTPIPISWIDYEYSVDLEFSHVNGQDTNRRDELWVYYNNARICVLTHLHQLQNLYFSLTGTELEVKL